ncbi:hypothetical protein M408DRAFT_120099 [Serendipita vermifera MAFF 305830]|uniref:Transmembrane protein n=1 Tax=Serendipita vermifera MAFF 305830 TaxID=933852 RepID=A0A0C2WST5_SERVB|nr:hypothetical protein M408DRAFT_120099 [Serendipita vermifera MAFF 305830]
MKKKDGNRTPSIVSNTDDYIVTCAWESLNVCPLHFTLFFFATVGSPLFFGFRRQDFLFGISTSGGYGSLDSLSDS